MFIAHLPAGYVLTKILQKRLNTTHYLWLGLTASILPDTDLIYFYLIDHRQTLHHSYWIHTPFHWFIITVISFAFLLLFKQKKYMAAAVIFFSNIFLHLFLDTVVGKIEWLYPFSDKQFYVFDVPAVHDWWVYNFVFHWTFLFEVALIIWAIILFIHSKKNGRQP